MLTDGDVGNTQQVIELVKANATKSRQVNRYIKCINNKIITCYPVHYVSSRMSKGKLVLGVTQVTRRLFVWCVTAELVGVGVDGNGKCQRERHARFM